MVETTRAPGRRSNQTPDYEMDEVLELTTPEQFKALGDPLRQKVLELLMERAATTNQLADALGCPNSTMAHHLHVLVEARLVKVVRTRQVRAMTERYYGCTARAFIAIAGANSGEKPPAVELLYQALKEIASLQNQNPQFLSATFGHTRIPEQQAQAFTERLDQLAQEFEAMREPGEPAYSFLAAVYRSNLPELPVEDGATGE